MREYAKIVFEKIDKYEKNIFDITKLHYTTLTGIKNQAQSIVGQPNWHKTVPT